MAPARALLALAALVLAANSASACIYIYGNRPNANGATPSQLKPETYYDFHVLGQDWGGLCASGTEQSPIDFPKGTNSGYAATAPRTMFNYPDLISDGTLEVINTGHNIQVQWGDMPYDGEIIVPHRGAADSNVHDVLNYDASEITAVARGYPAQFHFHTESEHTMEGHYFPLEMHIVNLIPESELPGCDGNCIAPVGVLFKEVENGDNPFLEQILKYASMTEGEVTMVPEGESIDISTIIPNGGGGKYLQYKGGLTTPPCIEGFLWHVFTHESYVSRSQMNRFKELMSFKSCTIGAVPAGENATTAARKLHGVEGVERHMLPAEQIHRRATYVDASGSGRQLLQDDDDVVCEAAAYGYNNRRVQLKHGRTIMRYANA